MIKGYVLKSDSVATVAGLVQRRAAFNSKVRAFFAARDVPEVETPLLADCAVSDPHIDAVRVPEPAGFLQTSPEFAMKRLLAAGSGDIYQLCKAFRCGEQGRLHRQEFTMLEWYRLGFDQTQLIEECAALFKELLSLDDYSAASYKEVFSTQLGVSPHSATTQQLRDLAEPLELDCSDLNSSDLLDLLFSHLVQPKLAGLSFVYDYPAAQAALARVEADVAGVEVARRFECFYNGVELANGYHELLDADEYRRRHNADNERRKELGKPLMPLDASFYAAMQAGLPDCAGVAVGMDRLFMLACGEQSLGAVLLP